MQPPVFGGFPGIYGIDAFQLNLGAVKVKVKVLNCLICPHGHINRLSFHLKVQETVVCMTFRCILRLYVYIYLLTLEQNMLYFEVWFLVTKINH